MGIKTKTMKGQSFQTPEGEVIRVEDFDAANKMAYVHVSSGQYRWYIEAEYSQWESVGTAKVTPEYIYVPDIPAQMIEEVVVEKPKKSKKKADA